MRGSIRARVTVVAVGMVTIVLVVAGVSVTILQRNSLVAGIDQALRLRADDLTSLILAGEVPDVLAQGPTEGFAQLVAPSGQVLASSPNISGAAPLISGAIDDGEEVVRTVDDLPIDDDRFRVLSRPTPAGVLHVGTTFDVVLEAGTATTAALSLAIPVAIVVLGVVIWRLTGTTLRPVDLMAEEVGSIGSSDLDRRVRHPGRDDEVGRLAITMNAMLDRVENAVRRQRDFVTDASHELRSPLARLRTELELARFNLAETNWPVIESLLEEVVKLQALTEDLLFVARLDGDGRSRDFVLVDLDDVVLRETDALRQRGSVDVDRRQISAAMVFGDRFALTRLVRNLLENAERHARGQVTVSLREDDGVAHLEVSDDGYGIPAEKANKIFERFGRADEARVTGWGGVGLGLAIVKDIAERHGGGVTLENPGEEGAVFRVILPSGVAG